MGLLDSVIGAVGSQILGGQQGGGSQAALIQMILSMLSQQQGGGDGLGALLQRAQQSGLGDVAASWVSTGQNLPISAGQIQDMLGGDMIGQVAQQMGMDQSSAAGQLAQWLPQVVDAMTPNGQVPASGSADLGALLPQVLGKLLG